MGHSDRLQLVARATYYLGWVTLLLGGLIHFSVDATSRAIPPAPMTAIRCSFIQCFLGPVLYPVRGTPAWWRDPVSRFLHAL